MTKCQCLILGAALSSPLAAQQGALSATSGHCSVSGRVLDDLSGSPLEEASVQLQPISFHVSCAGCSAAPAELPARRVVTGPGGTFLFQDLAATSFTLTAAKSHYQEAWPLRRRVGEPATYDTLACPTEPLTLRLSPVAGISGTVREATGESLTRQTFVSLYRVTALAGWPRLEYDNAFKVEADGTYRIDQVLPGRYFLVASARSDGLKPARDQAGHYVGEVPVRYPEATQSAPERTLLVHEGEQATVDFQLAKVSLHRVSGTVHSSQNYAYNLADLDGAAIYFSNPSEPSGMLEAWLPDGTFQLSTGRPGEVSGSSPFEVAGNDVANLSFTIAPKRMTVPVEVTGPDQQKPAGAESGENCSFLNILLLQLLPSGYVEAGDSKVLPIQCSGPAPEEVRFESVVPGKYALAVTSATNLYARSMTSGVTNLMTEALMVQADREPDPIRITLARGAQVSGIVRGADGPAQAWVYAIAPLGAGTASIALHSSFSLPDGTFKLEGLAPDSYLLFASDVELNLNVHDPAEVDRWRGGGQIVAIEGQGKQVTLKLSEQVGP